MWLINFRKDLILMKIVEKVYIDLIIFIEVLELVIVIFYFVCSMYLLFMVVIFDWCSGRKVKYNR